VNPFPNPVFKDTLKNLSEILRYCSFHHSVLNIREKDDLLVQEYFQKKMIDRDVEAYNPGEQFSHPDGFSLQIRVCDVLLRAL
jgi:hypothetical protein